MRGLLHDIRRILMIARTYAKPYNILLNAQACISTVCIARHLNLNEMIVHGYWSVVVHFYTK